MRRFEDTHRHKGMRRKLVEQLRQKGITSEQVLKAIEAIPRHFFLDSAFDEVAYEDRAFPIHAGQTISQPYTVAYQTQLLQVIPFERVLEIGTGSGYQAAVLAEIGALVFSIERQRELFNFLKSLQPIQKYKNLQRFYGDGFKGLPTYAPFDKIIITAAAPFVPQELLQQLKVGGWMVIPEGKGEVQQMKRITRVAKEEWQEEVFEDFSFVPMLTGKN